MGLTTNMVMRKLKEVQPRPPILPRRAGRKPAAHEPRAWNDQDGGERTSDSAGLLVPGGDPRGHNRRISRWNGRQDRLHGSCCRKRCRIEKSRDARRQSPVNRLDPSFRFSLSLAPLSPIFEAFQTAPILGISGPVSGRPIQYVLVTSRRPAAQHRASFRWKQGSTHRQRRTFRRKLPWVESSD